MYIIAGKISCKPGATQALTVLAKELMVLSRSEPGCVSYNFYEDKDIEGDYLFFEEWRSREDIDSHFQKPYFLAAIKKFPDLIIGTPLIKIYQVGSVEEV